MGCLTLKESEPQVVKVRNEHMLSLATPMKHFRPRVTASSTRKVISFFLSIFFLLKAPLVLGFFL